MAERLAGETGAHDVDRFHLVPVDGCQVAEVRCFGPVVGEQLVAVLGNFRVPGEGRAEVRFDSHVEAAVPGAERSEPHTSEPSSMRIQPSPGTKRNPQTVVLLLFK